MGKNKRGILKAGLHQLLALVVFSAGLMLSSQSYAVNSLKRDNREVAKELAAKIFTAHEGEEVRDILASFFTKDNPNFQKDIEGITEEVKKELAEAKYPILKDLMEGKFYEGSLTLEEKNKQIVWELAELLNALGVRIERQSLKGVSHGFGDRRGYLTDGKIQNPILSILKMDREIGERQLILFFKNAVVLGWILSIAFQFTFGKELSLLTESTFFLTAIIAIILLGFLLYPEVQAEFYDLLKIAMDSFGMDTSEKTIQKGLKNYQSEIKKIERGRALYSNCTSFFLSYQKNFLAPIEYWEATNAHCYDNLLYGRRGNLWKKEKDVFFGENSDIVLRKSNKKEARKYYVYDLDSAVKIKVGDPYLRAGYPQGKWELQWGQVFRKRSNGFYNLKPKVKFKTEQGGSSGSPVINEDNKLIGIIYASSKEKSVVSAYDYKQIINAIHSSYYEDKDRESFVKKLVNFYEREKASAANIRAVFQKELLDHGVLNCAAASYTPCKKVIKK